VYREDSANLCITSLSFNPSNMLCSACPTRHNILERGGGAATGQGVGGAWGGIDWSLH
jgi:hypothetical protein